MRQLATIERIVAISPIEGADRIESAMVRGWNVVIEKGTYRPGDLCVYVEIDAFIPEESHLLSEPFKARNRKRKHRDGRSGYLVQTRAIRGALSQGMVFPLDVNLPTGECVDEIYGITIWEPQESGSTPRYLGDLPWFVPKTTAGERVQNTALPDGLGWTATEKIDGTSISVWVTKNEWGVCSRNRSLAPGDNLWWEAALRYGIHRELQRHLRGEKTTAVAQGEVFGRGVQGNPLQLESTELRLFNLIIDGKRIEGWPRWANALAVPRVELPFPSSIDSALAQADGQRSQINPDMLAEGIVWTSPDGNRIKVISNDYLLGKRIFD